MNLIYDSLGSNKTPKAFFHRMAAGGIAVVEFNPIDQGLVANGHRDHRKILVVDGRIAFTGGINITAAYRMSSAAFRRTQTRPSLEEGGKILRVIGSGLDGHPGAIYLTLLSAIANAARSVHLTTGMPSCSGPASRSTRSARCCCTPRPP